MRPPSTPAGVSPFEAVSHDLPGRRVGGDQGVVGASFSGVVAGGHRHVANSVGGIRRTPAIRPSPLMRYGGNVASLRRCRRVRVIGKLASTRSFELGGVFLSATALVWGYRAGRSWR